LYGFSDEVRHRARQQLIARPTGPMAFRFVLQPVMAGIAALHDGIEDAKSRRSAYCWTLLTNLLERGGRLREGLISTARVILLRLCMDVIYQLIVLKTFYPGEAVVVAIAIAFFPHLLLRGPIARIARWRAILAASVLFHGTVPSANSEPNVLSPTRTYRVTRPFTDDGGRVAMNISGLACMPADGGRSKCLVIDDQGRFAQIAIVGDGQVAAGARLPLVGKKASNDTVGRPPAQIGCSGGKAKFKDIDGEAVAYSSPFFYVVGGHGCTRYSNKFRSSAFILARIPEAQVIGASSDQKFVFDPSSVTTTYRLSEALTSVPQIRPYFTQDLMTANGLNIEGLVVAGGKLLAGLRAPTLDAKAFVIAVSIDKLFEGTLISEGDVRVIPVPLGIGRGIRDLAPLGDGKLLVLSGPAQDERIPFEIHVLDTADETSTLLGTLSELEETPDGKAEAISVLSHRGKIIDLLMMFDGLESGGPRQYRILIE